jgi:hypothetical protein
VVCYVCGTYKGTKVLAIKHRVTRAERRTAERARVAKEAKEKAQLKAEPDKKK